jgi:hypothetical protein
LDLLVGGPQLVAEAATDRGQLHAAAGALEQWRADAPLQLLDRLAGSGCGHVEPERAGGGFGGRGRRPPAQEVVADRGGARQRHKTGVPRVHGDLGEHPREEDGSVLGVEGGRGPSPVRGQLRRVVARDRRRQQVPAVAQHAARLPQRAQRSRQVVEHVQRGDGVEGPAGERQPDRVAAHDR